MIIGKGKWVQWINSQLVPERQNTEFLSTYDRYIGISQLAPGFKNKLNLQGLVKLEREWRLHGIKLEIIMKR